MHNQQEPEAGLESRNQIHANPGFLCSKNSANYIPRMMWLQEMRSFTFPAPATNVYCQRSKPKIQFNRDVLSSFYV